MVSIKESRYNSIAIKLHTSDTYLTAKDKSSRRWVLLATNTIILMRTRHQHREEKKKGREEEKRRKGEEEKGRGEKGEEEKNAQRSGDGGGLGIIAFTEASTSTECSPPQPGGTSLFFVVERSYGKTDRANAKPMRLSWTHGAINTGLNQPKG